MWTVWLLDGFGLLLLFGFWVHDGYRDRMDAYYAMVEAEEQHTPIGRESSDA